MHTVACKEEGRAMEEGKSGADRQASSATASASFVKMQSDGVSRDSGGSGGGGWGMPSPRISTFHASTAAVTPETFVEMEAKQKFHNQLNASADPAPTPPSQSIFGSYGRVQAQSHSQRSPLPPLSLHGTFNQHVMKMHHHLLQQRHEHEAQHNR